MSCFICGLFNMFIGCSIYVGYFICTGYILYGSTLTDFGLPWLFYVVYLLSTNSVRFCLNLRNRGTHLGELHYLVTESMPMGRLHGGTQTALFGAGARRWADKLRPTGRSGLRSSTKGPTQQPRHVGGRKEQPAV